MTRRAAGWLAAYIASIVLANWMTATFGLVPIGFGLLVTAGTFAAGAALVLRDGVQVNAGKWWTFAAIGAGAAISALTSTPAIAVASGIAFLASELVDFGVFSPLRGRSLPGAVIASSVVSAPVDTILFLAIAGFGVTWQAVLGQFLVKTVMALLAAAWLWKASANDVEQTYMAARHDAIADCIEAVGSLPIAPSEGRFASSVLATLRALLREAS